MIKFLLLFLSFSVMADIGSLNLDSVKTTRKIDVIETGDGILDLGTNNIETLGTVSSDNLFFNADSTVNYSGNISSMEGIITQSDDALEEIKTGLLQSYVHQVNTSSSTTSSVYTSLVASETTPPAGTWIINYGAQFLHSRNGGTINVALAIDNTNISNTVTTVVLTSWPSSNATIAFGGYAKVQLNGSQVMRIRWNTPNGTATAVSHYMGLIRIGD